MPTNSVFNSLVCIMGILILTIHVVNLMSQVEKRKDEKILLYFFLFTIVHFATYLAFTIIKESYTSNAFIIAFYTVFYIFNNIEVILLFWYARTYIDVGGEKNSRILALISQIGFVVFVLLDIINIFTGIFFTAKDGVYLRSKTMIISQGYQFIMFSIVVVIAVINKKLNIREKLAFVLYCIIPLLAIILQNVFKGYAIAYASIIISIEILFLFLSVQRNIELVKEEQKYKDVQIKLMLSQIKPHFMYNSLSAISTLITIDPKKAQEALDNFTAYLRMNLTTMTEVKMIPFEDELKHIETYIALEQMRFNDRLKVEFDIQAKDFDVPPLTIQPIVENAVKHGVLKKLEGGTVKLSTKEEDKSYVIEVEDDGIGFNMEDINFDNNVHVGLNNIKYRLNTMCRSDVSINSEIGKGTKITVIIYK